jgi:two-component system cell cycle response regulator DivK
MPAKQILIVEGDTARRHLLAAQLRDLGQGAVIEAATGPEALGLVVRESVNLVLLAMQLPGLEGWEVARRIRALPAPERDIPILGFTAHARSDDEQKVIAAGCDDYIAKPESDCLLLKTKVEQLLAQGKLRYS